MQNSSEWSGIEPLLDEAMESLDQSDRTAILLRFFEDKSLREVGQTLGTSEDAAQKRVSRALELLRAYFSKNGRTVGVSGLAVLLTAHAAQSAPAGLKAAILSSAALSGTGASTIGIGITKSLAMTTLQKAIIGATLAAAVGTGLYEAQRASEFRDQAEALLARPAPGAAPNDALHRQLEEADRQLAALQAENEKLKKEAADVLRLRREVARLKDATHSSSDPAGMVAKSWLSRLNQLKDRLQQTPGAKIPELQYLTDKDWLSAAKEDLNTDEDYRRALSYLRNKAEETLINTALQPALKQYAQVNNGHFPSDFSQLQPFFNPPVDDAVLQRWEIGPASTVPSVGVGDFLVTQIAPVDLDYDNRYAVGLNGWGTSSQAWDSPSSIENILKPALQAYAAANNGSEPSDPSQLTPYLTTLEQQSALQRMIQRGHHSAYSP
jgi:hypothetical protein